MDPSLVRRAPIREGVNLESRADVSNVTNTRVRQPAD
jgi:hypothetical protein